MRRSCIYFMLFVLCLLMACGQQGLPLQTDVPKPSVQPEPPVTEPVPPEEPMVDYWPRATLADTHRLPPNGSPEVRLAHVTVEKIWDGVFASGPSRDAKQLYAVAECRVHELLYANDRDRYAQYMESPDTGDLPKEGELCYIWFYLEIPEENITAAYDRFCAMLNQTDSLIVYGRGGELSFDVNKNQGRAVAEQYGFPESGNILWIAPTICMESLSWWGIIPISDGKVNGQLMEQYMKDLSPENSMLESLDQVYTCGYFDDGDDLETLLDGLRRYVEETTAAHEKLVAHEITFVTEPLRNDPLPVFDQKHTVVDSGICGDIGFTIYQLKGDPSYYLYITVNGVNYDLGAVDAGGAPIQDIEHFKSYILQRTEISEDIAIYKLRSSYYRLLTTVYFSIRNDVPVVLCSIDDVVGSGEECDLDWDGRMETVCAHGGSTNFDCWIYEWDVDSGKVHIASVNELLCCYQSQYVARMGGYISAGYRTVNPDNSQEWDHRAYVYRGSWLVDTGVSP